jgi:hypothetical protein
MWRMAQPQGFVWRRTGWNCNPAGFCGSNDMYKYGLHLRSSPIQAGKSGCIRPVVNMSLSVITQGFMHPRGAWS